MVENENSEYSIVAQSHIQQDKQAFASVSQKLRTRAVLTRTIYGLLALGIVLEPLFSELFKFSGYSRNFAISALFLWLGMAAITAVHEFNAPWTKLLPEAWSNFVDLFQEATRLKKRNLHENADNSRISALLQSLAKNNFMINVLCLFSVIVIVTCLERMVLETVSGAALFWLMIGSFSASMLCPVLSIVALQASRRVPTNAILKIGAKKSSGVSVRTFCVTRGPYLGAYSGFCIYLAIFSFGGLGATIASWLHSSLRDAFISYEMAASGSFSLLVSALSFMVLFFSLSPLAVRISSSFQIIANRIFVYGDSLLEALMETANVKSTLVHLPEKYLAIRNIFTALAWLTLCYVILFSLVAWCPPPLGYTINNWLRASLRDASLDLNPHTQMNVRLFLASIFAGYGAVPMAVMSCVFLAPRKDRTLIISKQGILFPNSIGNLAGFSPLKYWENLKNVSISSKKGGRRILKLSYGWLDQINLDVDKIDARELAELLSAADEYAPCCKFDANAIAMRLKILSETKASSLVEAGKFSSTIFSPLNSGEFLNDNKYRIVRKLASKALSTVYLARDQISDKHVVIKEYVLPSNAQQRERMLQTFEREFKLLSALNHNGIAQVIEMFEEADVRYLVIEYIKGDDLRSIVQRRGRRSERMVLKWAREICEIMIFLHQQKPPILHRDLSPDNLMEDADGKIKLIDFGAAHQFMEGVTGTLIGKQCYIAPEQLRGSPSVRSDIYSFGCTLFFLLAGKDPVALKQSELDSEIPVSDETRKVIRACTEFDEIKRPGSFQALLNLLGYDNSYKNVLNAVEGIELGQEQSESSETKA